MGYSRLAAVLLLTLPRLAAAQTAVLRIRVVEGEGVVHAAGSRNTLPITVQVTDETGKPVGHATVGFHLPEAGPSGTFLNGLRTDIATTDATGHAHVRGVKWNRIAGPFQIRIVASIEKIRAGVISNQYIEGPSLPPSGSSAGAGTSASRARSRWLVFAALAAGGAVAGVLLGHSSDAPTAVAAATPAAPVTTIGVPTIGVPTITLGKP